MLTSVEEKFQNPDIKKYLEVIRHEVHLPHEPLPDIFHQDLARVYNQCERWQAHRTHPKSSV